MREATQQLRRRVFRMSGDKRKLMTMKFLERVAAPDWFVKDHELSDKLYNEQADILGKDIISKFEKLGKKKLNAIEEVSEAVKLAEELSRKGKLPPIEVQHKVAIIQKYSSLIRENAWARFRYESIDGKFATADKLHYDEKNKFIEIVK